MRPGGGGRPRIERGQRRLAGAAFADQADDLARRDRQVDALQRLDGLGAVAVGKLTRRSSISISGGARTASSAARRSRGRRVQWLIRGSMAK